MHLIGYGTQVFQRLGMLEESLSWPFLGHHPPQWVISQLFGTILWGKQQCGHWLLQNLVETGCFNTTSSWCHPSTLLVGNYSYKADDPFVFINTIDSLWNLVCHCDL
jgi:hypothetical protein